MEKFLESHFLSNLISPGGTENVFKLTYMDEIRELSMLPNSFHEASVDLVCQR